MTHPITTHPLNPPSQPTLSTHPLNSLSSALSVPYQPPPIPPPIHPLTPPTPPPPSPLPYPPPPLTPQDKAPKIDVIVELTHLTVNLDKRQYQQLMGTIYQFGLLERQKQVALLRPYRR